MKKILFIIASIFVVTVFLFLIPAFSISPVTIIKKYDASEKEKIIIYEVYDKQAEVIKVTCWSIVVVYGLFAGAIFFDRRNKRLKN